MRSSASKVVLFNAAAILVILAAAELASRVVLPANPPFEERADTNLRYRTSGVVSFYAVPDQTIYHVEDGRPARDKVDYRINGHGFRGEDVPDTKGAGEVRIAVIGGSHVFDQSSHDHDGNPGFPRLVQDLFRERGSEVTVVNAGVPGTDTRYYPARIALDLHHLSPDIVVVNSIWNDLKWISRATDTTQFLGAPPMGRVNPLIERANAFDRWLGFSSFYRHARDAYWRSAFDVGQEGIIQVPDFESRDLQRGLEQYEANIVAIVQVVRGLGALPVLALEERLAGPENGEEERARIGYGYVNLPNHDELVQLFADCDAILRSVSEGLGVPLIDANSVVGGQLRFFDDHVHTTPAGSRAIAEHYTDVLAPAVDSIGASRS